MWKTTNYKGEGVIWYSEEDIKPFLDPYFKGLDFKTLAELAKKSIRITAENRKYENTLVEINNLFTYLLSDESSGTLLIKVREKIKQQAEIIKKVLNN